MTSWRRVQGDVDDQLTVVLEGVADLNSAVSVEAHVWRDGVAPIVLAAAITDPVARVVVVDLGGAAGWLSTARPGVWFVDLEVTFGAGAQLTWPAGVPATIAVRANT